jgi:hypothetical protein
VRQHVQFFLNRLGDGIERRFSCTRLNVKMYRDIISPSTSSLYNTPSHSTQVHQIIRIAHTKSRTRFLSEQPRLPLLILVVKNATQRRCFLGLGDSAEMICDLELLDIVVVAKDVVHLLAADAHGVLET